MHFFLKKTLCVVLVLCRQLSFSLSLFHSLYLTPCHSFQLSLSPPQSVSLSVVLFSHRPLQFPFRVNKFMHAKVQSVKCTTGLRYAMRIASAFRLCAPCVLCYVMVWHVVSCLHQIFVSCTQICSSHEIFYNITNFHNIIHRMHGFQLSVSYWLDLDTLLMLSATKTNAFAFFQRSSLFEYAK